MSRGYKWPVCLAWPLALCHLCWGEDVSGGCGSKLNEQIGRTDLSPTCSLEPSWAKHQEIWRFLNNKMYACAISHWDFEVVYTSKGVKYIMYQYKKKIFPMSRGDQFSFSLHYLSDTCLESDIFTALISMGDLTYAVWDAWSMKFYICKVAIYLASPKLSGKILNFWKSRLGSLWSYK